MKRLVFKSIISFSFFDVTLSWEVLFPEEIMANGRNNFDLFYMNKCTINVAVHYVEYKISPNGNFASLWVYICETPSVKTL